MRVTDPPPASDRKPTDSADSRQKVGKDEHTAFSRVLSKKREGNPDGADSKSKHSGQDFDPAATGLLPGQTVFDTATDVKQVGSSRLVSVPPELQQLVREISVAVTASGEQQVHLELNSSVLKGLHILIEKRDGAVAIQFQSSSEQVSALLTKNMEALSQGLAERGMETVNIDITGPQQSARTPSFSARSGPRGQSGGQRSRR